MRVLQIINNLQPAGAEMLLRDLVVRFDRRGWSSEMYLLHSTDSWLEREVRHEIPVYDGGKGSPYRLSQFFRLAHHLRRHRGRYDLIHVHLFPAQLYVACSSVFAFDTVPIVATEHSTTNRRRQPLFRVMDRWMYRRFATSIGVSGAVSTNLAGWLGQDRCPVVWNGVALNRFQIPPGNWLNLELRTSLPLVLSIGRFHPYKDHSTAIRAIQFCEQAALVLVGDGPELPECRRLAQELGVSGRVWFLGERKDIPELIAACALYVQCSRWEGFGIAVVEAMAGGLPVIGTRVEGVRDVIGEAGLFFEPGNHHALASLITEVLGNREIRDDLSTRGRIRAQEFDIERTADSYCRIYEQVVRDRERSISAPPSPSPSAAGGKL